MKGGGAVKIEFPEYVLRILGAYENTGYEAYAVGGCVRDSLLGRTPHDWDIASSARRMRRCGSWPRLIFR